jgi:hypothetical protein
VGPLLSEIGSMKALRHRGIRLASALLFAALLLVPLVESGHSHANKDLARPCATCVAAHHSPAAAPPIVALAVQVTRAATAVVAPDVAPLRQDHTPQSGRAPPFSSFIASV